MRSGSMRVQMTRSPSMATPSCRPVRMCTAACMVHAILQVPMDTTRDPPTIAGTSILVAAPSMSAETVGTAMVPLPSRARTVAVLMLTDALAVALSLAVATLWHGVAGGGTPYALVKAALLLFLVPAAFALGGLYPAVAISPVDEFRRLTVTIVGVFAIVTVAHFAITASGPLALWTTALLVAILVVPSFRAIARELFARRPWWGVPVVVLGSGRTATLLLERLAANPRVGMRAIACLDDDAAKTGRRLCGVPVAGPLADVRRFKRLGVRHVLVAMPGVEPERLVPLIRRYGRDFPAMIVVPNLFGLASEGVSARDLGGVLGIFVQHNLVSRASRAAKACLDVALLVPALLAGLPVIALAALAVMVASPGHPFYAQEREGKGGRSIRVWKIRTMRRDAGALLERHLAEHPEARAQWERHFKLDDDPRIIPGVGTLLRVSSLDELPQVLNVLRGEMSFVGPRPFPRYHLEAFTPEFREFRASVLPGLTGLWQVSARSDGDLQVQEDLDTYYIRNWSIWMDLYVLARTPIAVLLARGAR